MTSTPLGVITKTAIRDQSKHLKAIDEYIRTLKGKLAASNTDKAVHQHQIDLLREFKQQILENTLTATNLKYYQQRFHAFQSIELEPSAQSEQTVLTDQDSVIAKLDLLMQRIQSMRMLVQQREALYEFLGVVTDMRLMPRHVASIVRIFPSLKAHLVIVSKKKGVGGYGQFIINELKNQTNVIKKLTQMADAICKKIEQLNEAESYVSDEALIHRGEIIQRFIRRVTDKSVSLSDLEQLKSIAPKSLQEITLAERYQVPKKMRIRY